MYFLMWKKYREWHELIHTNNVRTIAWSWMEMAMLPFYNDYDLMLLYKDGNKKAIVVCIRQKVVTK